MPARRVRSDAAARRATTNWSPSAASTDVLTPEDPFVAWPGEPDTVIVPMFLLFDYTFRPPEIPVDRAVAWARESGVVSGDESMLRPDPWPSLPAWCHARVRSHRGAARGAPRRRRRPCSSITGRFGTIWPGRRGFRASRSGAAPRAPKTGRAASAHAPSSPAICTCARRSCDTASATKKCRSAIRATGARIAASTGTCARSFQRNPAARTLRSATRSLSI